jgi:putative DNA primase/helicase
MGAQQAQGRMMQAAEIHVRLGGSWPVVLAQLGIPETALRNKHGPCPACGGKDRYRFDNKRGRGDWYCSQCGGPAGQGGAGDGFALLERVHGWPFSEARKRVIEAAGLSQGATPTWTAPAPRALPTEPVATPTERVRRLRRDRCRVEDCDDAVDYLASRGLWPLPEGCTLSGHATVEYWADGQRIGRYPAIVADVVDVAGELVTVHITHLQGGKKLVEHEPRKILSPMTGRVGCAVRLMRANEVLGIAEGIETALSAALLEGIPTWAALNDSQLAKFEPPPGVQRLVIYPDHDANNAGDRAAYKLIERLQGCMRLEVRPPPDSAKDWNDILLARNGRHGGEGIHP